jgi:superfamily II RNA helicase
LAGGGGSSSIQACRDLYVQALHACQTRARNPASDCNGWAYADAPECRVESPHEREAPALRKARTLSGPLYDLLPPGEADGGELLGRFLDYVSGQGLTLYPAQEEALLELFEDKNVILNTPTGSGKTLVAAGLHFASLAHGRRSVYTSPIKALVNEKWMALCRELGPANVGLSTGDATVNREAPVLCCTAEVLANVALREGGQAAVDDVVMDEFHWYADRDRGVAWQVPLLSLPQARFLLMSATLGEVSFFAEALTRLNGLPTVTVKSGERPVPLEYAYSEIAVAQTLEKLVSEDKAPVYVVHFTQKDAADGAQDFTSLNLCTREEKNAVAEAIKGFRFTSPYGPDIRKWLKQGIGLHHAGLLPKYRVLIEQLAQRGLLKVICGTDTLGVGINVPIRTVLFTRLCKFDGQKTAVLSARDFHQIAGRAGRKGFDDRGFVVAQAPEHVIENLRLEEKAKEGKKVVKRRPPDHNFANWDLQTYKRLMSAPPERLNSRFEVSHGMLLNVLSRRSDGCRAMQALIRDSHEPDRAKKAHFRRGWQLFRALVDRGIVEIVPRTPEGSRVRVNVELQEDFSMNQALSLYLLETIPLLEAESETHALDLLTLVESILEEPELILRRQLDKLKGRAVAEMKAEGLDYDQRMEKLEQLEHPKPLRDFVYATFNAFADRHPWVSEENIRPKSIAREMFEGFRSFSDYVQEYDLERSEGLLLRHLNSVYKVLRQTVPEGAKTDTVREMELYLRDMLRQTDSSLLEEWERMQDPNYRPAGAGAELRPPRPEEPPDVTRDAKAFTAAIRTRVFAFLRAWSIGRDEDALEAVDSPADGEGQPWTVERLRSAREAYAAEHERLRLDPEARNLRHTYVQPADDGARWRVQQMLIDPEGHNDWVAEIEVDLASSREIGEPVLKLLRLATLV